MDYLKETLNMLNMAQNWIPAIVIATFALQFLFTLYLVVCLRSASRERRRLNLEMFGLLKKIEGITAHRREQMLRHYDKILENLSSRLPASVAAHAGECIFDAEAKILERLAEIEPLADDDESREKLDAMIKSMESLEARIVSLTAEAVHTVMAESRRDLFRDPIADDPAESLAA